MCSPLTKALSNGFTYLYVIFFFGRLQKHCKTGLLYLYVIFFLVQRLRV
jgi:hypothetical protein